MESLNYGTVCFKEEFEKSSNPEKLDYASWLELELKQARSFMEFDAPCPSCEFEGNSKGQTCCSHCGKQL